MKFYIEGYPSYKKEIDRNSLIDVLVWASKRIIGRMDFNVYSKYPYTVDNLVYQHKKDEKILTPEQMKNRILLSALALAELALAEYPKLSKVSAELNTAVEYKPLMEILQDISNWFGDCSAVQLKTPVEVYHNGRERYEKCDVSEAGWEAYNKLTDFIYKAEKDGFIKNSSDIIETLDDIIDERYCSI